MATSPTFRSPALPALWRDASSLRRTPDALAIGPSELTWQGDSLVIRVDETGFPWPVRVRGEIRLHPQARPDAWYALDPNARHHWSPLAPLARVEVNLSAPGQRWTGPRSEEHTSEL